MPSVNVQRGDSRQDDVRSFIQRGLSRTKEESGDLYSCYSLPTNPFPFASIASPESASEFPPLISGQLTEILDFLRSTLESGRFAGLQVVGDYGMGKTHLLRWLGHQINGAAPGELMATYIQNPGTTLKEFVGRYVEAIGLESLRKRVHLLLLDLLRNRKKAGDEDVFRRLRESEGKRGLQLDFRDSWTDVATLEDWGTFRALPSITTSGIANVAIQLFRDVLGSDEQASALASLAFSSEHRMTPGLAASTAGERYFYGVAPDLRFRVILRLLQLTGTSRVYLLFDEFEDITSARLSKRNQAEYQAAMKMMIDQNLTGFALVLAVTPNGLREMTQLYPPLTDRLTHRVDLLPLSSCTARTLVMSYLDYARKGLFQGHAGSISPFALDGLELILGRGIRNPRAFLGLCHRLLAWGRDRGCRALDAGAVEEFLGEESS